MISVTNTGWYKILSISLINYILVCIQKYDGQQHDSSENKMDQAMDQMGSR